MRRREFVAGIAGSVTATGVARSVEGEQPPAAQDPAQPEQQPPDPLEAEIEARMALVLARYGDRLDEGARKTVRADIRAQVRRGARLKKVVLTNGDEPFPVFVAYRGGL